MNGSVMTTKQWLTSRSISFINKKTCHDTPAANSRMEKYTVKRTHR